MRKIDDEDRLDWFAIGDAEQAVEIQISKNFADGQLFKILNKDPASSGPAVAFSVYHWMHNSTEHVLDTNLHESKGVDQFFVVNADQTISPRIAQNMVWGFRSDNELILVPRGDKN